MCDFFSFVTYKGEYFYHKPEHYGKVSSSQSHSVICHTFKLPCDKVNKFESIEGAVRADQINDEDGVGKETAQRWFDVFSKSKEFKQICKKAAGLEGIGAALFYSSFTAKEKEEVVKGGAHRIRWFKNPSKRLQEIAVRALASSIMDIDCPSEKAKMLAVKQDGFVLTWLKNPSEKLKELAIKQNGLVIRHIMHPSEKLKGLAVKQNGMVIEYIKEPSERVKELAVRQNGWAIKCIANPSERVQLAAVKSWPSSIYYISGPLSPKVLALHKKLVDKEIKQPKY